MDLMLQRLVRFGKKRRAHLPLVLLCVFFLYAVSAIGDCAERLGKVLRGKQVRRLAACALSLCMVANLLPMTAFAAETGTPPGVSGICGHVHDEDCGYSEVVEGAPCTHSCEQCDPSRQEETPTDTCICDSLCTEGIRNLDCPLCGKENADLAECKGKQQEQQQQQEQQACICETKCRLGNQEQGVEESRNPDCPVCQGENGDLRLCIGEAPAVFSALQRNSTATHKVELWRNNAKVDPSGEFETLDGAIGAATAGDTLKIMNDFTLSNRVTMDKTLTLDLNGHTITYNSTEEAIIVSANVSLTVTGTGGELKATGTGRAIKNADTGTVEVQGGTVSADGGSAIYNYAGGKIIVSGGTVQATGAKGRAIDNNSSGTIEVTNGKVEATGAEGYAIYNNTGNVNVSGGTVTATDTGTLCRAIINNNNTGTVTISGGEVTATGGGNAIHNVFAGEVKVTAGTVSATNGSAIWNNVGGTITVSSSGKVEATGTNGNAIYNNYPGGTIVIEGGTVSATGTSGKAIYNKETGSVKVKGGTVSATTGNAIFNFSTGKITISGTAVVTSGNSSGNLGTIYLNEVPTSGDSLVVLEITGGEVENTANPAGYAVYFANSDVTADNLSSYYTYTSGTVGRVHPEQATDVVERYDSNNQKQGSYTSLAVAIQNVQDNDTLKIIGNIDLDTTGVEISGKKTLILDLNGHEITYRGTGEKSAITLLNGASLTVTDGSGTGTGTGKLQAIGDKGRAILISSANATINVSGGTVSATTGNAIYNYAVGVTVNVSGGTVSATTGNAIYNAAAGAINVTGGTVSATTGRAIYNYSAGEVEVTNGTVTATGGTGYAIHNYGNGKVAVSGGEVTASGTSGVAIRNESADRTSGTVQVSGGKVEASGERGNAIINGGGTITVNGGTVAATDQSGCAIFNDGTGKINISGTAVVTSGNTSIDVGTIHLNAVPTADPFVVLDIQGGEVKNTTGGFAVYFTASGVNADNLSSYYTHTSGTVGRVHPAQPVVERYDSSNQKQGSYTSLSEAIGAAATTGDTLKIIGNIDLGSGNGVTIDNKNLTLDLNGHTITYSGTYSIEEGAASAITLANGAALTIKDSSTEKNGKLEATGSQGTAICNKSGGAITIGSGTVSAIGIAIDNNAGGAVNVSGGTVFATGSQGFAIDNKNNGTITITGGKLQATGSNGVAISNQCTGKITISGNAVVTSEAGTDRGTISFTTLLTDRPAVVLDIQGGTVENTANPAGFAVHFGSSTGVTAETVKNYYTVANGATVGTVHPTPVAANVVPTVEKLEGTGYTTYLVYANGAALIINGTSNTSTTIYVDVDRDGVIDEGVDKSLNSLSIANAPGDNADLTGLTNCIIYGGGKSTSFTGNTKITMLGGHVNSIYGGGFNNGGDVIGSSEIILTGGHAATIYGGGNYANLSGSTKITVGTGGKAGSIYGVGEGGVIGTQGTTETVVTVLMEGEAGTIYGGGDKGEVYGNTAVTVTGTVNGNVYGGGNDTRPESTGVNGNTAVIITGTVRDNVYGGGQNNSTVTGTQTLTIGGGAKIGGTNQGIIINATSGVESFKIDPNLSGDNGSVFVVLPSGYTGGTIATEAVEADLAKITLTGDGAAGKEAYLDGTDIKVRASSAVVELLRGGNVQSKYNTLSGAITAAQDGDTLKIIDNIDLGTTGVEISGKSLTLDLNGKTVTYSGVYSAIVLKGGANLTVTDGGSGGRLKATDSADSAIANDSTGTVTVSGGTVTASSSYGNIIAIANESTGKVTVTGGTVSATGAEGRAILNNSTGKVTVTGGTVEATDAAGIAIRNLSTGKITISGSAVVTSENTFATEGTIYFREVPTPAAVVLEITGGTVENTASPADNSVYFYPDSVTAANLSSYYSHTGGTVGRVHPAPPSAAPTVTSVTVSPNPAAVQKGMTQQFTAIVSGTNNPAQTVSWTVTGGKTGTDISNTGLLTVAADETAATLTVTAISAVDTTKSGAAAVTVQSGALTDAQKLAMAKSAIAAALDHLTVTNAATAQDILDAANVATLYGVAVAWDGTGGFSKTEATTGAAGSITGTLRLTLGGAGDTVTVSKVIAILPDKTALTTAIAAANSAKNSVVVRDLSPSSVASGTRFVTTAEMEALNIAIAAAQTVMDNSAAAAAEITAAVSALNRAVTAFNGAIKTGTYTGGSSSGSGGSSGGGSGGGTVTPPTEAKPSAPTESEIKVDGKVDANGSVTVTLPEKTVDEAIKKAEDEARKNGNLDNGVTLVLNVRGGGSAGSVTVNLPKTTQETIISKKIVNTVIVVNNPDIKIGMDLSAVTSINTQAKADVNITATKQDNSKLTGNAKTAIGARPVFDLRVNYGGGKQVADFDGGSVSVAIPYTLGAGEKAGGVYAVYVDGSGNVQWLTSSVYDAENKVLRFNTNHFSTYGVGYQAPADFTDIAGHWAEEDIQFVVNRGLLSGTGAAAFSPNTAMTRGMFVTALGRLAGADVSGYKQSSFTDVKADAYYMSYVEWAAKNGIVKGTTSATFAPDNAVTREQMAVIVANYAKAIGFELPKAHAQNTFADAATISPWAADSVKAMQMAGVLAGKNVNRFDPQGTAARAEAAATLRHFMELMIDASAAQGWMRSDNGQWMYYENGSPVKNTTRNVGGENYSFNTYGVTLDFPKKKTGFGTYTVQAGDSFWLIAEKHNVSMHTLAEVNGKTIYSVIHPGDALKIPQ